MTQITTTHADHNLIERISSAASAIFMTLAECSRGARCAREVERLSAMSDAELAGRGLTRDGIVRHAFRPYLGL